MSDNLDKKLNEVFAGKVVRKDLVHHIKKAANVPSFVLEFLLSKYCATDDPNEIESGKKAVLEVIESNYVRPDESNSAQSKVQQLGRHKFIDKIHVKYHEKERRHWAEMENFGSKRIAISEKFYRENGKLLEGGMWAEITLAHNEIEEDDYAFYVEDLRPIQLARFNETIYFEGRKQFTRDEWIDVILKSVGLNPEIMDNPPPEIKAKFPSGFRLKMHFLSRLIPIVQNNFNFIELGPRGTGKSYFYSEFSPYSTLLSGGQASTATLLYNNRKEQVGAVGFWDNIAFDEVGNMKIKDSDTIQIMKDYMANGRFSRGKEVIANASFSFVGNIDQSIDQLVNSYEHNLFVTLPKAFDLAIQDRFYFYLPGWEIPKMDNKFFTQSFGLITDYMAEAFHYMFKHNKDYVDIVGRRLKLGPNVQGRDESAIRKTVTAYIKLIHPAGDPSEEEFNQLVEFAIEGRRRVKEQMNKTKPDDEFALIDLSYFKTDGTEVIVYCPESKNAKATQNPRKTEATKSSTSEENAQDEIVNTSILLNQNKSLEEKRIKVLYGDTGYGYESLFYDYLVGATEIVLEDAYIRQKHQINNFLRLCEIIVKIGSCKKLTLITSADDEEQKKENILVFDQIANSLFDYEIEFRTEFSDVLHDRELKMNHGWNIKMGRGLDYFQSLGGNFFQVGTNDLDLRPCLETSFDFYRVK
ncbi:MAG: BREX system Lon protease-like protein BrxL [Bacteroidetes bacterium]|nr:BREX system Lon protease-like protein BrxL [Bacteroidota bacterium]